MKSILDRCVLLFYCFGSVFFAEITTGFLIAFLSASIYSFLHYYMNRREYRRVLSLLYLTLSLLIPEAALFVPAVLYGFLEDGYKEIWAFSGVLCLFRFWGAPLETICFIITGAILSLLLSSRTRSYKTLEQKFKQTRDDSVERNLLLKEKNQALLEKQDYEIYTATLKERNRIAREIHDNVGHMLTRSILLTGAVKTLSQDAALAPSLEQLETTLNTAMTNIRNSVHDLHDESVGLKEALESLADSFSFCPVFLEYDVGYEVPKAVKYCLIAVAKEALNNVMRHSNANEVRITLREHPALYQLMIEDNGTKKNAGTEHGLGLQNMRDRVAALKGVIQIDAKKGFRIFITIPKREDFSYDQRCNHR